MPSQRDEPRRVGLNSLDETLGENSSLFLAGKTSLSSLERLVVACVVLSAPAVANFSLQGKEYVR
jgi:hypothetical protein